MNGRLRVGVYSIMGMAAGLQGAGMHSWESWSKVDVSVRTEKSVFSFVVFLNNNTERKSSLSTKTEAGKCWNNLQVQR